MKIINIGPGNGKAKVCSFDIEIEKWGGFILQELLYFRKENNSWINFHSKEYEKDGKKKFWEMYRFSDSKVTELFKNKAKKAIEEYLSIEKNANELKKLTENYLLKNSLNNQNEKDLFDSNQPKIIDIMEPPF